MKPSMWHPRSILTTSPSYKVGRPSDGARWMPCVEHGCADTDLNNSGVVGQRGEVSDHRVDGDAGGEGDALLDILALEDLPDTRDAKEAGGTGGGSWGAALRGARSQSALPSHASCRGGSRDRSFGDLNPSIRTLALSSSISLSPRSQRSTTLAPGLQASTTALRALFVISAADLYLVTTSELERSLMYSWISQRKAGERPSQGKLPVWVPNGATPERREPDEAAMPPSWRMTKMVLLAHSQT